MHQEEIFVNKCDKMHTDYHGPRQNTNYLSFLTGNGGLNAGFSIQM